MKRKRNKKSAPVFKEYNQDQGWLFPPNLADAGYGSEENYVYLDKNQLNAFVKFNYFHKEQKKKFREDPFRKENFVYNKKTDSYTCPAGKKLSFVESKIEKTKTGYKSTAHYYECDNCEGCNLREQCHSSKYDKSIQIRPLLEYYKTDVRSRLKSAEGKKVRSLRPIEVESVFGHIKWNRGFKRFLLRGLDKVKIEWGLLCLAHNMLKVPI